MNRMQTELLPRLLSYDGGTGKLFWLHRTPDLFVAKGGHTVEHTCAKWNAKFAGSEAFTYQMPSGYFSGRIFATAYLAHRVIWALMTGEWPTAFIDHIDRDKSNNRFNNLRLATKAQNAANVEKRPNCSSQYRGVCWQKLAKKWTAGIAIDGRRKHLGLFDSEVEAARAYDAEARKQHGVFANQNIIDLHRDNDHG